MTLKELYNINEGARATGIKESNDLETSLLAAAKNNYMNLQSGIARQASNVAGNMRETLGGDGRVLGSGAALEGYLQSRLNPQAAQTAAQFTQMLQNIRQQGMQNRRQTDSNFWNSLLNLYGTEQGLDEKNKPFTFGDALPTLAGIATGVGAGLLGGPALGLQVGSATAGALG